MLVCAFLFCALGALILCLVPFFKSYTGRPVDASAVVAALALALICFCLGVMAFLVRAKTFAYKLFVAVPAAIFWAIMTCIAGRNAAILLGVPLVFAAIGLSGNKSDTETKVSGPN
jgi:hypothetical protein